MKTVKILEIGDMQYGFTRREGNLYVTGAEEIIAPVNTFLQKVKSGVFDYTLVVLDTHFTEEYLRSEERKQFPIHCEFGTKDWELTVDISGLPNKHYIMKNNFNLWTDYQSPDILIHDKKRESAHDNLFYVINDLNDPSERVKRDAFIHSISPGGPENIEVTLLGVASDYCNRYAMEGWLERGARVTIISDLTRGIAKNTEQVLCEKQYQKYTGEKLRSVRSSEYLRELHLL